MPQASDINGSYEWAIEESKKYNYAQMLMRVASESGNADWIAEAQKVSAASALFTEGAIDLRVIEQNTQTGQWNVITDDTLRSTLERAVTASAENEAKARQGIAAIRKAGVVPIHHNQEARTLAAKLAETTNYGRELLRVAKLQNNHLMVVMAEQAAREMDELHQQHPDSTDMRLVKYDENNVPVKVDDKTLLNALKSMVQSAG